MSPPIQANRTVADASRAPRPSAPTVAELAPGLHRITLPQPAGTPAPFDAPVHVYALTGDAAPVLVNAGHVAVADTLLAALRGIGVVPELVDRVVVTGAWPDLYGGLAALPRAEAVVLTPEPAADGVSALHVAFDAHRRRWAEAAAVLMPPAGEVALAANNELAAFLDVFLQPPPSALRVAAVGVGDHVEVGAHRFEVRAAAGTLPGGLALVGESTPWLFSAELLQSDEEAVWVADPDALLEVLEKLFDLSFRQILPNRGRVTLDPRVALKRASLFVSNFVANARFALQGPTTAAAMVSRDLGLDPHSLLFLAHTLGYQAMLERMAHNGMAEQVGEGLGATFVSGDRDGVFEDPDLTEL